MEACLIRGGKILFLIAIVLRYTKACGKSEVESICVIAHRCTQSKKKR